MCTRTDPRHRTENPKLPTHGWSGPMTCEKSNTVVQWGRSFQYTLLGHLDIHRGENKQTLTSTSHGNTKINSIEITDQNVRGTKITLLEKAEESIIITLT